MQFVDMLNEIIWLDHVPMKHFWQLTTTESTAFITKIDYSLFLHDYINL